MANSSRPTVLARISRCTVAGALLMTLAVARPGQTQSPGPTGGQGVSPAFDEASQLTSRVPTGEQISPMQQRISLDLRDATLLEALFAVRDASGLNLVVGNEVTGTVNAAFTDSAVSQVLDSLLLPRGYGYRMVSGSLVIVPLEHLGDNLPWFETEVIRLENATPNELISTVESLLSPEGRVHAVPSSNSLVVMDYPEQIVSVKNQVRVLEGAAQQHVNAATRSSGADTTTTSTAISTAGSPTVVQVYEPQFVPAAILAEGVTPLLSDEGRLSSLELEDKLVISDRPEAIDRITAAIEKLDRPRPQVRIRALIYDCGLEDVERLGVNWGSGLNSRSVDSATGNPAQSIALNAITAAVPANGANGTLTLSSLNRYSSINTVVQALESSDDSRLLADPNVVVMNHETAEIEIVTEIPYQQLTQGLEGGTIGTTEFREAGVTLNVIPHIAQDGTIAMVVNPRFSLLTGFSEPDNAPIIDRRETKTTVRVFDQQTLVLGGLRQRTRTVERSLIPGLGRIPKVGHLFRHKSLSARESELLVFITPEIVMPDYHGTPREACVGITSDREINQAPTCPLPFGMPVLRAEDVAYRAMLDSQPMCNQCGLGHGCRLSTYRAGTHDCCCNGMIETEPNAIEVLPTVTSDTSDYPPVSVTPAEEIPVRISASR